MDTRNLGNSGLLVSLAGLGCNNFGMRIDVSAARAVAHKALDLGVTLFDTADIYGGRGPAEEMLGEVLGPRRKDIVLATKFGYPMGDTPSMQGASRRYIVTAVEASLTRLRTDWIDLYQLHGPDPRTPIEETLRALDDLTRDGKIRYSGSSNLTGWQTANAHWTAQSNGIAGFISCQNEYNLLSRDAEAELIPAMAQYGLGLLPYFPLAGGMLTGKYRRDTAPAAGTRFGRMKYMSDRFMTESNWRRIEALNAVAAERGRTMLELAMGWLAARPQVGSVIAGATTPEQVEANVAALDGQWSPEDEAAVQHALQ